MRGGAGLPVLRTEAAGCPEEVTAHHCLLLVLEESRAGCWLAGELSHMGTHSMSRKLAALLQASLLRLTGAVKWAMAACQFLPPCLQEGQRGQRIQHLEADPCPPSSPLPCPGSADSPGCTMCQGSTGEARLSVPSRHKHWKQRHWSPGPRSASSSDCVAVSFQGML